MKTLSLQFTHRDIAFAYFEAERLVSWGNKRLVGKSRLDRVMNTGRLLRQMVETLEVDGVLLPEFLPATKTSQPMRLVRVARLTLTGIVMKVEHVGRDEIRNCFRHLLHPKGVTKAGIACWLGERFPELKPVIPVPRTAWRQEDYWMPLFEAVARAVVVLRLFKP